MDFEGTLQTVRRMTVDRMILQVEAFGGETSLETDGSLLEVIEQLFFLFGIGG